MERIERISIKICHPEMCSQVDLWSPVGRIEIDKNVLKIGDQVITCATWAGKIRYVVS